MTTLYDHRGNAVDLSKLKREQATGSVTQLRNPYAETVAYGLTPANLAQLLRNAKDGDHERYLILANEMEERDGHYFSQIQTRKLASIGLERSVQPADDSAEAATRADELNTIIQSAGFGIALMDVMDAIGKGFSVTEIHWDTSESQWWPKDTYQWRDQRWFKFDYATASEIRLIDGTLDGQKLVPFKYIYHQPKIRSGLPLANGLARVCAALHLFKSYAVRDWMAFAEVFGMPLRIGKYPVGATEQERNELKDAVRMIGSDAAAVIANTMAIEFERVSQSGSGSSSDSFYGTLADWLDKQVSKAVVGQTSGDEKGGSFAKAKVLDEIRADIRNSDVYQLENTLNCYLAKPWYDLNYGVPPKRNGYPRIVLDTSEPDDLELLSKALPPFIDRGLRVQESAILEKFGLQTPDAKDILLRPATKGTPDAQNDDNGGADDSARMRE